MRTLCTLSGGPAAGGCYLDLAPGDQEATLYFTPAGGLMQKLTYRRVGPERFAFVRSEPYTREPEKPTFAVAHSEEKLPPPEIKDWERRASESQPGERRR